MGGLATPRVRTHLLLPFGMPSADTSGSGWARPATAPSLANRVRARRDAWLGGARAWLGPVVSTDYEHMHAERLFPLIQLLSGCGVLYAVAELVVFGFETSLARGLVYLLVVGPALLLLSTALIRVALSFMLALVRIADDIEDLGDLPRWVRGLSPRRMLWPPAALDNRRDTRPRDPARGRRV